MTPVLILSTIIFFIISIVGCLILTLSSKKIEEKLLRPGIIIHFISLVLVMIFFMLNDNIEKFNLVFFCSGILLSGIIIRKNYHLLLKIYFGLFLSLVLFFVYSPSLLAYFITGNYSKVKSPQTINLKDNYYLGEQQSMLGLRSDLTTYKLYKKNGLYKKTILRNIDFGGQVDSIELIKFTDDTLIIKGFLNKRDTTIYKKPGIFKKGDIRKQKK